MSENKDELQSQTELADFDERLKDAQQLRPQPRKKKQNGGPGFGAAVSIRS